MYLYFNVFICVVISLAISATFLARVAGTSNATDVRACEAAPCRGGAYCPRGLFALQCCFTQYPWTHHDEKVLSNSCTCPPFCTFSSSNRSICKYITIIMFASHLRSHSSRLYSQVHYKNRGPKVTFTITDGYVLYCNQSLWNHAGCLDSQRKQTLGRNMAISIQPFFLSQRNSKKATKIFFFNPQTLFSSKLKDRCSLQTIRYK